MIRNYSRHLFILLLQFNSNSEKLEKSIFIFYQPIFLLRNMKKILLLTALLMVYLGDRAFAQMPHDAIYMPKKTVCAAVMYGHSSWNQYWENTLKRENFNMGTHTTQSAMLMAAVGITDRLNVIVSLPYVWTKTSAGNLMGQSGLQDASAWVKYKALAYKGLSLSAAVGGSLPASNYVPDFLPMSIGLQCRTASGRLIANYTHPKSGLYLNAHSTYTWRSNIRVDRDAYQADGRVFNTNEVGVPNAIDAGVRLGILKHKWQAEVFAERFECTSGDNIRRNDMPFPTNNMRATMVGAYAKVQPKNLGLNASVRYTTDGLNMGQTTSFTVGILYQLNFTK